jgi:hypothetical protein
LLVLGVVRMYGRAHGYQVRRELLGWSADKWANVQPGSIYHALKKMTAKEQLEQVDVEPGEGGPDRTGSPTGSPRTATGSSTCCSARPCPIPRSATRSCPPRSR